MRQQELHIIVNTPELSISIDKITKFALRSPDIRYLTDQVGLRHPWFFIDSKILDYTQVMSIYDYDIYKCGWVDDKLNHPVYLPKQAFPEILEYVDHKLYVNEEIISDFDFLMMKYIKKIINLYKLDEVNEEMTLSDKKN